MLCKNKNIYFCQNKPENSFQTMTSQKIDNFAEDANIVEFDKIAKFVTAIAKVAIAKIA